MRKKTIILGAGESGVGAAILAAQKGHDVFVSDSSSLKMKYKKELEKYHIPFEEGQHSEAIILGAAEVIKSPGIPEKNTLIKKIRATGIPVISEIEFAYRYKGDSKIVAITGSNGKTTTTALLWHMCTSAGIDAALAGNIGHSFAGQVATSPKPLYVLEISSFQLDDIDAFRPDIAILTNITEDHLDRYEYQFTNYISSKFRITRNQQENDFFIYCADDPVIMANINHYPMKATQLPFSIQQELAVGTCIKNEQMIVRDTSEEMSMSIYDFTLKGKHNQYNTMAAATGGVKLGLRKEKIRAAIQTFESLEHRTEFVAKVRGITFVNDSKATNVNSTWYALESTDRPVILILGGVDKGNDYTLIMNLVKEKVKAIVCLGIDNRKIHEAFGDNVALIVNTGSIKEAVRAAYHFAEKGDTVLLSPACASFDLFDDFEDRGKQFREAVREL